jgi:pimeloyl-ACP methyl ester carboxylesterase
MQRQARTRALGRLVGDAMAGGVGAVHDVHHAIAGRAFSAVGPASLPVQSVHDGVAHGVYGLVRVATAAASRAAAGAALTADALSLSRDRRDRRAISGKYGPGEADCEIPPSCAGKGVHGVARRGAEEAALAAVNGLWGDTLARRYPELAVPMALRSAGRDVSPTEEGLAAAYRAATGRLAVFVHGLCESDESWTRSGGHRGGGERCDGGFGTRLRDDLGFTPLYVRYNSGLHVSDNGQRLAELMADVMAAWPVPVEEVALIGHSMGGLVARSACHYALAAHPPQAAGQDWVDAVRHVFCLGTPHLGAPLEKATNAASWLLASLPETRPAARVLNLRSAGVKDLRFGSCVEDDWRGVDPDEVLRDRCIDVPFLPHATYYFVGATVTADLHHPLALLVGDLLVQFPSASGRGRRRRLAFEIDNGIHLGGLHHFNLLNHPSVYRQLHAWLSRERKPGVDSGVGLRSERTFENDRARAQPDDKGPQAPTRGS